MCVLILDYVVVQQGITKNIARGGRDKEDRKSLRGLEFSNLKIIKENIILIIRHLMFVIN